MASKLEKIIVLNCINKKSIDETMLVIQELVLPQKSKFGFPFVPADSEKELDGDFDRDIEALWFGSPSNYEQ